MLLTLIFLQAAQAPDIELNVHATARSVKIEQKGEAKLEVRAEPEGTNEARAEIRPSGDGAVQLRNVEIDVRARASIADPQQNRVAVETSQPN